MKKSKFGFALASIALLGASAFANKITMNGTEYAKIQDALDAIKDAGSYNITLEPGTYKEVLYYKGAADIKISGKSAEKYGKDVVISEVNSGDLYKQKRSASAQNGRCIFEFEGTGNLTLENLTMENTYNRLTMKGSNTQAETVGFDSTGNLSAYNCAFKSHQDTLRMTGKSWFYDCYVEGDTDFIWMEARGTVALFENCKIRALYDEKPGTPGIIGAPRMNYGNRIGKGLVIINSEITNEKPQMTFLGRTPWNDGYYNQITYINTSMPDVNPEIWQGKPLMAAGVSRQILGWKIDEASLKTVRDAEGKPLNLKDRDDILSAKDIKAEFGGRKAILNRVFDYSRNAYRKDYEGYWNLDSFIKNNGWKVTADKSKELGSGEKEANLTVYDFSNDVASYKDLKVSGFAPAADALDVKYISGEKGSTISFDVASKSAVKVYGLFKGKASIKLGAQGEGMMNFSNGSKVQEVSSTYIVYEKKGTVTITAEDLTCISKIVVEPDTKLAFVPVKGIKVSPAEEIEALKARKKIQMNAVLDPIMATNRDFIWSVSDENVAVVNEFGLVTAKEPAEDTVITVKATSRDSKKASGEYKLKVLKPNPNEFAVTWLGSIEASQAPYAPVVDNAAVMDGSNAKPNGSNWACNTSKFNASFADGALSYEGYSSPIVGNDVAYIEFPMTAKKDLQIKSIIVSYGNHGTGNVGALFSIIRGGKLEEILDDSSRKCRNNKKVYDDEGLLDTIDVAAGETIVLRIALYGVNGNGECEIAKAKSPTLGTVTVSGLAK